MALIKKVLDFQDVQDMVCKNPTQLILIKFYGYKTLKSLRSFLAFQEKDRVKKKQLLSV